MTREEIISLLEKADETVYKRPQSRTAQAIEEAIELIKQESKKDVLDKIRAEIENKYDVRCDLCEYFVDDNYEENDISEYRPVYFRVQTNREYS